MNRELVVITKKKVREFTKVIKNILMPPLTKRHYTVLKGQIKLNQLEV